jgi:hypothetical protein
MAKQDLYKTAQQSAKLFKLINENQKLEGWVADKISKAAEDISTVYQYLNYEKQFKDYSQMIAESTNLSEGKRAILTSKLAEAKEKVKELKKKAAKDKSEKMDENAFDTKEKGEMKVGDTKKTRTGELTKTSTGVVHKNTSYHDDGDADEKSGKGIKSHAKAQSAAEKKEKAPAQKFSPKNDKTWGMKDNEKFDNRDKVAEAKDKGDMDHDGIDEPDDEEYKQNKDTAIKKAIGKKKTDTKEGTYLGKAMAEGKKCPICKKDPCACGKSKKAPAKKEVKEADEGKHNNGKTTGFKAVAKKAAKEYGSKAAGERVAGAVRAKMAKAGKLEESADQLQYGDKKKIRAAIARAQEMLEGKSKSKKKDMMDMEGNAFGKAVSDAKKDGIQKGEKVKVDGKEIPLKESTDFDRVKQLTKHLLG